MDTTTNNLNGMPFLHDKQLEWLYKTLIKDDTSIVCIYGQAGVGKTTLAMFFKYKYQELFPGGVLHLHPHNVDSLFETTVKSVIDVNMSSLIIIDDVYFDKKLDTEVSNILKYLPKTKVIIVSRIKLRLSASFKKIELEMNFRDYHSLLEQSLLNSLHTTKFISELFKISKGNLVSAEAIINLLKTNKYDESQLLRFFDPIVSSGIIGLDGQPLSVKDESHKQITTDVSFVSNELLDNLYNNPQEFYQLTPRRFEEVVAEMLYRMGYEVTLTSESRDGGKDIYAAKKDIIGSFLYVVECKKYAPTNGVGIGIIQRLHGVVQAEKATAGIVATTSYFTRDSKRFQETCSHQLSLRDYFGLISWLEEINSFNIMDS